MLRIFHSEIKVTYYAFIVWFIYIVPKAAHLLPTCKTMTAVKAASGVPLSKAAEAFA